MSLSSVLSGVGRRRWLVTGAAGFIGSHLVETLLLHGQSVCGLDNFATGKRDNLDDVRKLVGEEAWQRFEFVEASVDDRDAVDSAIRGCDSVLHQAALGSVPRSIDDPLRSNQANVTGFLTVLASAAAAKVKSFVFASSSSVYGDSEASPKREEKLGKPLSPYAVTKRTNELYAESFHHLYQLPVVGLRYFNVFGPRQDPQGEYAAVIPRWIGALLQRKECVIFGDGNTSRDFCFVQNVVEANLLASVASSRAWGKAYNIACGSSTSLVRLYELITKGLNLAGAEKGMALNFAPPRHLDFRPGDVRHSLADIGGAQKDLGYQPAVQMDKGIEKTTRWFFEKACAGEFPTDLLKC